MTDKKSKTEKKTLKVINLRWNKEREQNKRGKYGKKSRSSTKKQKNAAKALEEETSQTPHIKALFQRQLTKIFDIFVQKN